MERSTKKDHLKQKIFPSVRHLIIMVISIIAIRTLYYCFSDGFNLERIKNTFPIEGNETAYPSENEVRNVSEICKTKFKYLGKGSQTYAFISEDEKYVLKLFKCYRLKPTPWLEALPLNGYANKYRESQLNRRNTKRNKALNSYKIATSLIKDECCISFLQIIPSNSLDQAVTIYDKIGIEHSIPLQTYGFILQKKANLVFPTLEAWIKNKQLDRAKEYLSSLVGLIVSRSKKGVQDSDPDLDKNAGVIGTTAVFIDVGSFHYNKYAKNPEVYKSDLNKITAKLKNWLKEREPSLVIYLEDLIQNAENTSWTAPT